MNNYDTSTVLNNNFKKGFTLLELILVIGMLAIIAATVIIAINPTKSLNSAKDAARRQEMREIENAIEQYIIDGNSITGTIPTGISNAKEICQTSVTGTDCTVTNNGLDLSFLVPGYLVDLPIDPTESGSTLSGYYFYRKGAFYETCSPITDIDCAN